MARDPEEMAAETPVAGEPEASNCRLQEFKLYETRSRFYMIGRDKNRTLWRVLKIDRLEPSELNIAEDSTTYSEHECDELLKRIDQGNRSTGGLKLVTNCYGIIGFFRFLGPYYMLLITKRKPVGIICGHTIYQVTKSQIVALPNSTVQSNMANFKNENRYKKLLCIVDLTKDFFFSYSYHIMRSLEKNTCDTQTGNLVYDNMFVWNEFMTRGIRNHLRNTQWTIALVHGFFKQEKLSVSGKDFRLTLIARRSCHYAGTRYLKRGVNEKGRVANDVETEQIVFEDVPGGTPTHICSVVQYRGSIPLFWSQETSKLNLKPDIVLRKKDKYYEATRLHFENLLTRYGSPIIILNLIKSKEKKPRESILRSEFANAIEIINKDLPDESQLKYLHWDLHRHSRRANIVLKLLGKVAENVLSLTGFFFCEVTPALSLEGTLGWPSFSMDDVRICSCNNHYENGYNNANNASASDPDMSGDGSQEDDALSSDISGQETTEFKASSSEICLVKPLRFQKGVLRTNCIDCLDRTNVAQYAYGLAALGHQLHALELIHVPTIDLDDPLADDLMTFYETMGDTLAMQYGGSSAHNKIFSERRGQWKAATQSQEFFRTLQRYYSNAYIDAEKQAAINLFLGHFQPQEGKPAIWELDSDQHCNVGKRDSALADENTRSFIKRSLSDGNILRQSRGHEEGDANILSDSTPEISLCERDLSYSRLHFPVREYSFLYENGITNFLDLGFLNSPSNSFEKDTYNRARRVSSPMENIPTENVINGITSVSMPISMQNGSDIKEQQATETSSDFIQASDIPSDYSDSFMRWVINEENLCY